MEHYEVDAPSVADVQKFLELVRKKLQPAVLDGNAGECLLNDRNIGDTELALLVTELEGLRNTAKLTKLDLVGNVIGDAGAARLAEYLASDYCSIQELDLYGNRIGDSGALSLAKGVLKRDRAEDGRSGLSVLDLRANPIGPAGIKEIAYAKSVNHSIVIYYDNMLPARPPPFLRCPCGDCSVS
jgi:hypothetical protein